MNNRHIGLKEKIINLFKYKYSNLISVIVSVIVIAGMVLCIIFKLPFFIAIVFWAMYILSCLLDRVSSCFKKYSKEDLMENKLINTILSDYGFVTYIVLIILIAVYYSFVIKLLANMAIEKSFIIPALIITLSFLIGVEVAKIFKKKLKIKEE